MRRRDFTILVGVGLAIPASLSAQPADRLRRIGVLIDGSPPHPLPDALRAGLQKLGHVEGRTIAFDVRYAEGKPALGAEQAAELVRSAVDVIVAHFTPSVRAAMTATKTIPIVMAPAGAPVETGLVAGLAGPAAMSPASPTWRPSWAAGACNCSRT